MSVDVDEFDLLMMRRALELAREAIALGEVPVGAVIVTRRQDPLSGVQSPRDAPRSHGPRRAAGDHARRPVTGSWRLEGCTLYVTLEPCPMCAGAIVQSRIARVVYGAADPKAGACESLYRLVRDPRLNHRAEVTSGVLERECGEILSLFFQERRALSKLRDQGIRQSGGVPEWLKGPVSKTGEPLRGSVGLNPTSSARSRLRSNIS